MKQIDSQKLKDFVQANPKLVRLNQSVLFPELYVVKYSRNVFWDNLWDADGYLRECRGLIVDADFNVVVRPFEKIYNYQENGTTIPLDEEVTAVRKVNGFMAAATFDLRHKFVISTTGSLDSEFADLANQHLARFRRVCYPGWTYLFEICDPTDPHIITEMTGAYLIGARRVKNGEMMTELELDRHEIVTEKGALRPNHFRASFAKVLQEVKTVNHEGFVVHGKDTTLKIKSVYYLVTKLFARIRGEKLTPEWFKNNRQNIDEEFYPLFDHIERNAEWFKTLDEEGRLSFIRNYLRSMVI